MFPAAHFVAPRPPLAPRQAATRFAADAIVCRQKVVAGLPVPASEQGRRLQHFAQMSKDCGLFLQATVAMEPPTSPYRSGPYSPKILWDLGDEAYEQNDWPKTAAMWQAARQFCGLHYADFAGLDWFFTAPVGSTRRQASHLLHFNELHEDFTGSLMSSDASSERLDEVLALDATHVPALLLRAAVAAQGDNWSDADSFLSRAFAAGTPLELVRPPEGLLAAPTHCLTARRSGWRAAAAWWPQQPLIQLTWAIVQFGAPNGVQPALDRMEWVTQKEPDSAQPSMVLALNLETVGRWEAAEQNWRRALLLPGESPMGRLHLGCILFRRGAGAEAEQHLATFLDFAGQAGWAHHEVGLQLATLDGLALARGLEALRTSLAEDDAPIERRIEAAANAGNALRRLGRPAEGISLCQRAVDLAGEGERSASLYAALARAQWDAGDTEQALANFGLATASPAAPLALIEEYGARLRESEQLDQAVVQLQRLRAAEPDDPRHVLDLAACLLTLKRPQEAQDLLNSLLQRSRTELEALCLLVGAKVALGDVSGALASYREALLADPGQAADIASDSARYFLRHEQEDVAEQVIAEGLRANPQHAGLLQRQAILSLQRNDLDSAQEFLRRALQIDPNDLTNWRLLLALTDDDNPDQAQQKIACLRNHSRLEPADGAAALALAVALLGADDDVEAERASFRALALLPDDAYALHVRANSLMRTERIAEACACMQRALDLEPTNDTLFATYGCMLMVAGRDAEASLWLQRALDSDADNEWAQRNLALLRLTPTEE